jgi:hypothetical protein
MILTHIYFTIWEVMLGPKGGENAIGLQSSPFLAIDAKGGENIKPKAKGPHHHFKKFRNEDLISYHKCLFFNWYSWQFQISIHFQNPLES